VAMDSVPRPTRTSELATAAGSPMVIVRVLVPPFLLKTRFDPAPKLNVPPGPPAADRLTAPAVVVRDARTMLPFSTIDPVPNGVPLVAMPLALIRPPSVTVIG